MLDEIGAWDPFNVTEDADLGVRLAATGYRTARSRLGDARGGQQRSDQLDAAALPLVQGLPADLAGAHPPPCPTVACDRTTGFIRFTLLLAGTPIIAVLNLVFWLITAMWFLGQPALITAIFPWYVYFPALISLLFGNGATIYMNLIAIREDDRADLLVPVLMIPPYWLMMSIASAKGCYQLIRNPSYWEKTFHGLAAKPADQPELAAADT